MPSNWRSLPRPGACQGAAARQWLEEREAELLPVPYYHVVFTLPASIGAIAFQNKAAVYDLLFRTAAETLITIAGDPKHLGARIGLTAVLHTWGSALTHHPHVHVIVPGGALSPDGGRWIVIRRFLLHVLPSGFHRIRHYGLFAGAVRARNIERVRQLLAAPKASPAPAETDSEAETPSPSRPCPCCGGRMIIVQTFQGARPERSPSPTRIRIDSS